MFIHDASALPGVIAELLMCLLGLRVSRGDVLLGATFPSFSALDPVPLWGSDCGFMRGVPRGPRGIPMTASAFP